jgi:flavin reductase (DIM6/NTAB) family NADH-FMN oxidoreductase RutF
VLSFNPKDQTERENYKMLTGTVIPRPIAFVTSMSHDGILNGAPFSYFNIVSSNPPMLSVSVQKKGNLPKDTAQNIKQTKEFVVHIVDPDNVKQINETAATLAPEENELEKAGLTLAPSTMISVPGVRESKVRYECTLEQSVEVGEGTDLLIGKIVQFHIDKDVYEEGGYINYDNLDALSRLAGPDYAKVGEILSIKRPR